MKEKSIIADAYFWIKFCVHLANKMSEIKHVTILINTIFYFSCEFILHVHEIPRSM
jgi:hypothetical protein